MRAGAAIFVLSALGACARHGQRDQGGSLGRKEDHVVVDVKSSDDLNNLYSQYLTLADTGRDATLEVNIAPGNYGVASIGPISLNLGGSTPPKDPKIDVILRGVVSDPPVVFSDLGITVVARSLRLENLILTKRKQNLLKVKVKTAFSMKNVVVSENEQGAPWGGALLEVSGVFGQGAFTVDLQDTWFVKNAEASTSTLLSISAASNSYVDRIRLENVSFLGNSFTTDLAISGAKEIALSKCFVYEQRDAGDGSVQPGFVRYTTPKRISIEDSIFVLSKPEDLAVQDLLGGGAQVPVAIKGSQILVTRAGATKAPPGLSLSRTQINEAAGFASRAQAISEMVDSLGKGIPGSGARAKLNATFGIQ